VKTALRCLALAALVLLPNVSRSAPLVFSVSPGQVLQSAQVGMDMNTLMPYVGLDVYSAAAKTTNDDTNYSYDAGNNRFYVSSDNHSTLEGNATLLIPHVGARMYLGGKRDVRPYLFADLMKSMAVVSVKGKSTTRYYNTSGVLTSTTTSDRDLSEQAKSTAEDLLGFWGIGLGFGGEYAFSDHFSVGGEYALRWLGTGTEQSVNTPGNVSTFDYPEKWSSEISGGLKLTSSRIVMNFKF
jgi:hypothetical protein